MRGQEGRLGAASGYDAHRINWPRLAERVISGFINTAVYATILVTAHLLGVI